MKMVKPVWKILAIIFMAIFVLMIIFFGWALNYANSSIENENECSINICDLEDATSYYYDEYSQICYCYDADMDTIKVEYLK